MSEGNSRPVYEDITAVDTLRRYQSHVQPPDAVDQPSPLPVIFSNITFSTISQDTVAEVEEGEVSPTNLIPPYISRYDSLVTWFKSWSTGVQE